MHGVYLLWWVQERDVSAAVVAAILAAGDLALTALEVPTGWLADRYGHRACLIGGSALQAAGMAFCWLGEGIPGLLAASIIVALGDAFRSGADQALLYRSCAALDREADFQQIEAKTRAATLIALVVLLLAGGAIVRFLGFAAGWIAEITMSVAGLLVACAMVEPPAAGQIASAATSPRQRDDAGASSRRSFTPISTFAMLVVPASWLGGVAGATAFYAQTSESAHVVLTTILVATITLAEAAGAIVAARLVAGVRSQLILAAAGTAMLLAALLHSQAFLPAVVGLSFVLGVAEPLRATAIQRATADHVRARAASIASACDKAIATVALLIAGAVPRCR
jgi:MFS family permease